MTSGSNGTRTGTWQWRGPAPFVPEPRAEPGTEERQKALAEAAMTAAWKAFWGRRGYDVGLAGDTWLAMNIHDGPRPETLSAATLPELHAVLDEDLRRRREGAA